MPKHFMRIRDLGHSGAWEIIRRAKEIKETNYRGHCMDGKVAALIFEKASTRTRVSFDVAVRQLGGTTIFMTPAESQLGRSEPLRDTARVLSRYVDCLIVRTFGQEKLDELAEYGSLPVVNALTDQGHPCQLMADLLTIYERTPDFSKVTVTWVGDGNNMANSWIEAAMYFPFQLNMAIAPGYEPDQQLLALALQSGAKILPDPRSQARRRRRELHLCRRVGLQGAGRGAEKARGSLQGLLRGQRTHEPRRSRRQVPTLPARPSRRGSDRRGHGKRSLHCLG